MKAKLNQFTQAPQQAVAQPVDSASEGNKFRLKAEQYGIQNQPVEPPAAFDNATAEIADIDQRLHALQTFLRAAKAGGPANKLS